MTPEEILQMWNQDAPINKTDLGSDASNIPLLHAKYWKYRIAARRKLSKLRAGYKILKYEKKEFLINPTESDVKDRGWDVPDRRIIKSEITDYLDGDNQLLQFELKIGEAELLADMIEDILKEIRQRNWIIKLVADDRAFMAGQ
jgi:hypothetical protein